MEVITKQFEEETKKLFPKPEEGKSYTDEQKQQIIKKRNEMNLIKMKEFDKHMMEAHQYKFNTNVYKNVKLALSADELKVEEENVKKLADFITESAIPKLVKEL